MLETAKAPVLGSKVKFHACSITFNQLALENRSKVFLHLLRSLTFTSFVTLSMLKTFFFHEKTALIFRTILKNKALHRETFNFVQTNIFAYICYISNEKISG